jgi:hypothetical protein
MAELWNTAEVAAWWGINIKSVPSTMHRLGVPVDSREPGRTGLNLYRVDAVRVARTQARGQGYRSDLHTEGAEHG